MKLYRIQALLLKYWYMSTADLSRIFDMIYWPVIGVLVFGYTTLFIEQAVQMPDIVVFLLGGLIIWTLFERIQQDVSIFLLEDFWSKNIANTFATPLKASELCASLAIIGFIRVIITTVVMYVLALLLYSFDLFGGNLSGVAFTIPLILFGWALGILVAGVIFHYGPRIQIFAWGVTYLMQPIAAAYYPIAALPVVLQYVAKLFPLAYIFEGYRLSYAGTFSWHYFWIGTAIAAAYMLVGFWYFVYAVRRSRQKGSLARY